MWTRECFVFAVSAGNPNEKLWSSGGHRLIMCYKGVEQEEEATKSYCDQIVLATHTTPDKLCGCNIYIFGETGAYTDKQTDRQDSIDSALDADSEFI